MAPTHSRQNQLRIIGGLWRGRKLSFRAAEGLRPTTDRTRETLFNWLAPDIRDARCADLFAGSGAIGLEALSRGAAFVDFCDTSREAVRNIARHLQALQATARGEVHNLAAEALVARHATPWDIVFIDPPFGHALAAPVLAALARNRRVLPGALIYLETAREEPLPAMAAHWRVYREKLSGGVCSRLITVD